MIERATDAALHNYIANHPQVKPTFGTLEHYYDLTPLLDYPEQYVLLHDGIGAASIFEWCAPDVWQGHSCLLPERRGKEGIRAAKAMLAWMFEQGGAKMIWGMTPEGEEHRRTRMFNRLLGFRSCGHRRDDKDQPVELFIMEK